MVYRSINKTQHILTFISVENKDTLIINYQIQIV